MNTVSAKFKKGVRDVEEGTHALLNVQERALEFLGISNDITDFQRSLCDHFFNPSNPRGAENERLLTKLVEIYGLDYVNKQITDIAQDPKIHGDFEGNNESEEGYFQGMHFSVPFIHYIARRVLDPENDPESLEKAYAIYAEDVVKLVESQSQAPLDRMILKSYLEEIAKPYLRRFREKQRRMELSLFADTEISKDYIQ